MTEAAQPEVIHYRVKTEASGDNPHLGLGLYIASEIARAHGGELAVSSDPGETRFTLHFPLK